jgi:murein DD-endopeptidase MepM/ murein hydrolase activator NlpD
MHMHPDYLDADNVLNGRSVREGEVLGSAGNFNRRENLTTYHLHFEMMVPTQDGWVRVNPYMTLVASYERLLGERGREVEDPPPSLDVAAGPSSVGMGSSEMGSGEIGNGKTLEPAPRPYRPKLRKKRRR